MNAGTFALIAFLCIFGGALTGLGIRSFLSPHHFSDDTKDIVKLGAGFIATLCAMVLGLLVSSSKGTMDEISTGMTQDGAKIMLLDRVLADYGPETANIRASLRATVAAAIDRIWPEGKNRRADLGSFEAARGTEIIQHELRGLSPRSDSQRQLKSQALQIAADLAQSRWLLIEQIQQVLPKVFFIVLLFWLTMLFACFGLLSHGKPVIIAVLFVCALSVSGAIFLFLEMNTPLTGVIKVSSAPLQKALDNVGR
jgi:hypothetical protein